MKPLKITMLLAAFVLTVSGSSTDTVADEMTEIKKIDHQEFILIASDCDKKKKPGNNI